MMSECFYFYLHYSDIAFVLNTQPPPQNKKDDCKLIDTKLFNHLDKLFC